MNPPQYTCVPYPELSSLVPPHTIPLGRPSALAPSIQYRALNLDWQLVFIEFFLREYTDHSKHPLPTTQEKTLHMDITRWSTPKPD